MLNKHGLRMVGIRKASSDTRDASNGVNVHINYNLRTGEIFTKQHVGNSWTAYKDKDIILVACAKRHMSMQEIADGIDYIVKHLYAYR